MYLYMYHHHNQYYFAVHHRHMLIGSSQNFSVYFFFFIFKHFRLNHAYGTSAKRTKTFRINLMPYMVVDGQGHSAVFQKK